MDVSSSFKNIACWIATFRESRSELEEGRLSLVRATPFTAPLRTGPICRDAQWQAQRRCDSERYARGQLRLDHTARIPRTCVSRSTAPHFNRPMHIRPSLATLNKSARPRSAQRRAASIATRCSSFTHRPEGRLRAALFRD